MRSLVLLLGFASFSCGGIAVLDDGAGGANNGSSSRSTGTRSTTVSTTAGTTKGPGPTAATGAPTCAQLESARAVMFEAAIRCDACVDGPTCTQTVVDACGCSVPANDVSLASQANQAYDAWVAGGCGPLDCERPCIGTGSGGFCISEQGCVGNCSNGFD